MNTSRLALTLILGFLAMPRQTISAEKDSLRARVNYDYGGLEFQILLVSQNAVMENASDVPQATTTYKKGDNVVPIITFRTEHKDQSGNADLTYDMVIFKPGGTLLGEFKQQIMVKGRPIKADRYFFAEDPPQISLEEDSPLGVYKVQVVVFENVHHAKVDCPLSFQVIE